MQILRQAIRGAGWLDGFLQRCIQGQGAWELHFRLLQLGVQLEEAGDIVVGDISGVECVGLHLSV